MKEGAARDPKYDYGEEDDLHVLITGDRQEDVSGREGWGVELRAAGVDARLRGGGGGGGAAPGGNAPQTRGRGSAPPTAAVLLLRPRGRVRCTPALSHTHARMHPLARLGVPVL